MPLAYVVNPLNREANRRPDAAWIEGLRQSPQAKLLRINGDSVLMRDGALVTDNAGIDGAAVFLGLDAHESPWFACRTEVTDNLRDLRGLAMEEALPPFQLGILAQARSLIQWHERRTFCSNCGQRNEVMDAGYRRHCAACGMDHFPRTDPW